MKQKDRTPKNKVLIYTAQYCPYCVAAKKLLKSKKVEFEEIDVTNDDRMREKLVQMSGGRETVPQIFIDARCIGGYDDLVELYNSRRII
jgi:glutaredoxin 3